MHDAARRRRAADADATKQRRDPGRWAPGLSACVRAAWLAGGAAPGRLFRASSSSSRRLRSEIRRRTSSGRRDDARGARYGRAGGHGGLEVALRLPDALWSLAAGRILGGACDAADAAHASQLDLAAARPGGLDGDLGLLVDACDRAGTPRRALAGVRAALAERRASGRRGDAAGVWERAGSPNCVAASARRGLRRAVRVVIALAALVLAAELAFPSRGRQARELGAGTAGDEF